MAILSSFKLTEILESPVGRIALWVLIALVGLAILRKLWTWIRPQKSDESPDAALIVRLESPPEKAPTTQVLVRNLSSRLVAIVVAPLGGGGQVQSIGQTLDLVDKLVPGLSTAIDEHEAVVKLWPKQLSSTGFGHALLRYVHIPEEWRGSRWCAVCGPASLVDQRFLLGLVIVFDSPTNMELISVENDGEWPSVVRVADL